MRVLAINCGSSTLKWRLSEVSPEPSGQEERLAWGVVDGVGGRATLHFATQKGAPFEKLAKVADHGAAVRLRLGWLDKAGFTGSGGIDAVGPRPGRGRRRALHKAHSYRR